MSNHKIHKNIAPRKVGAVRHTFVHVLVRQFVGQKFEFEAKRKNLCYKNHNTIAIQTVLLIIFRGLGPRFENMGKSKVHVEGKGYCLVQHPTCMHRHRQWCHSFDVLSS